ncbi:MAG: alpha/beta hydrolase-fold protein [Candidatus Dormibacteraeota bacterium]|nr:alpha/beta hydrolase-fold protein [Candidatus Dormibacteraeota bacterium]
MIAAILVALSSLGAAGVGAWRVLASTDSARDVHVQAGGLDRTYRLVVPRDLPSSRPAPLFLVLHGYTWSAGSFEAYIDFDRQAAALGAVAVYPKGFNASWDAGTCCGDAVRDGLDDVRFIEAVVAQVESVQSIDRHRIYAVGFSNGAMLALRLACERPELFAAVASVAGELEVSDCAPDPPPSVLQIHGSADAVVRYPGFVTWANTTVFDWWRHRAECSAQTTSVAGPGVTVRRAGGCSGSTAVAEYEVAGGMHAWPRLKALDASAAAAAFLSAHPRG